MPRTYRTKRGGSGIVCLLLLIMLTITTLMTLIFGPNFSQNPFLWGLFISLIFISAAWSLALYNDIDPLSYILRRKKYNKEAEEAAKSYVQDVSQTPNEQIICPNCGVPQEKDTVFCTKCGKKLIND